MSSEEGIYGRRRNGGMHGDVFTSPDIIRLMLDYAGYDPNEDLSHITVLEPSCGDGAFLVEIQRRLMKSAAKFGFDAEVAFGRNVYSCELDAAKLACCISRLRAVMPGLACANFRNEDFLLSEWNCKFDIVVGNPPYVRYEKIPPVLRDTYKTRFATFHYRVDLYVLFYEYSLSLLAPEGTHVFICSDRWLRNEYGKNLRKLISKSFDLERIVNLEGVNAFEESEVLAYPSITVIGNSGSRPKVSVGKIEGKDFLRTPVLFELKDAVTGDDWRPLFVSPALEALPTIGEQGLTIGIGVATGADDVFISSSLPEQVDESLLMPVISARDLRGNTFRWGGKWLLNPYDDNGKLISLAMYPKAARYLDVHRERLERRHIVRNHRAWYALIDKIKPDLLAKPKILLPDMSGNSVVFVDEGRFYPAHNMYYVTGADVDLLEILAAVLMSSFVRAQIRAISNNMNGGFPRWQSQAIRKLRVPALDKINMSVRERLLEAYHRHDIAAIDREVDDVVTDQLGQDESCARGLPRQYTFDFGIA